MFGGMDCSLPGRAYAHSFPDQPEAAWEPLESHLRGVSARAAEFAAAFAASEWGEVAGLWHDLGKYSAEFQAYLRSTANEHGASGARRGPDHSTAGAQHAVAGCPNGPGRILAYCLAGHHGGLPDATDEVGGLSGLNARLKKPVHSIDSAPLDSVEAPSLPRPGLELGNRSEDHSFRLSVFCRMLFSCLVDADFLATEQFMSPDRAAHRPTERATPAKLLDVLNDHLAELEAQNQTGAVNHKRREVLADCRKMATVPPGLFSLTVPTGGGKTLSSMAFALRHAVRHELRRVIYAMPFTSIIEQNARVFREAFSALGDGIVLEHHSNFERSAPEHRPVEDHETYWDWLASENWDASVVVTTNVQLFESLFANKPSRCRKLHRIVRSVIVLDEVQTLPVHLLRPTLAMLEELCRNYGCTVVLCSATQPAVGSRDGFAIGLQHVREIIADPPALFAALKRVDVERIGKIDNEALAARLAEHDQVLCVVNTRAHAAKLYGLLTNEAADGVLHLSASMCATHRTDVLEQIRKRLSPDNPKSCRVVSTQVIEAGVDIDFPIVYRSMTGVDSIAQAAGRCNREGRARLGQVYVFDTDVNPRGDLRLRRQMGVEVAALHGDLLGLDAVEDYFELLYWSQKDEWDKHEIMKCFCQGLHFQFRQAASEYRLIKDEQQPVIVPYGRKGRGLIDELRSMDQPPGRAFSRRLQRFTVGVYEYQLEQLRNNNAVTQYHERFWALENEAAYDKNVGLRLDALEFQPERFCV